MAAGLVVSSFAGAQAGEFKPNLQLAEEFTYGDAGHNSPENFNATTRVRFGFDYVASEDLSATILFQYRQGSWGNQPIGRDHNLKDEGEQDHFRMRLAYIDWTIPGTDIKTRMGRHAYVLPSYAFGSPIMDGRGDGISLTSAINDNINVGFSWLRVDSKTAKDKYKYDDDGVALALDDKFDDDADAVILNAEFAYDGFKVAPWLMYAHQDSNAADPTGMKKNDLFTLGTKSGKLADSDSFVIGASAELNMFDPFVFALDALYSNTKYHNVLATEEDSFDGFYVGAKASYKFDNGTAVLGGWYASGADARTGHTNDTGFVVLDGGFSASSILFDGNKVGADGYTCLINDGNDSPFGTWGLIAEYADFSFVENLSHTARVMYVQGTNEIDHKANTNLAANKFYFTEDDSAVEIDFDTTYQIYKNFSATLQLGYVIFDQSNLADGENEQDDIFRSALAFVYKF